MSLRPQRNIKLATKKLDGGSNTQIPGLVALNLFRNKRKRLQEILIISQGSQMF
jgi:hypothetical protein